MKKWRGKVDWPIGGILSVDGKSLQKITALDLTTGTLTYRPFHLHERLWRWLKSWNRR